MRRKDREITSRNEIDEVLQKCKIVRIALLDKQGLYIVPMNFGYEFSDEELTIYIHSAKSGRKIDAFNSNANIAFEMDCDNGIIGSGDLACNYGIDYMSITGNGEIAEIEEAGEKSHALKRLMLHQTGRDFDFDEAMLKSVCVMKIISKNFSGKKYKSN